MDQLLDSNAPVVALIAAGVFFMTALFTGAWKYYCIMASEQSEAPYYVNIAHRASLLYSFAALLIAVFAALSAFPDVVNLVATVVPLFFFGFAIFLYIQLGLKNETDNQFRTLADPGTMKVLMMALMIGEIGGFGMLFAGLIWRLTM
jgi:hypothetical protein